MTPFERKMTQLKKRVTQVYQESLILVKGEIEKNKDFQIELINQQLTKGLSASGENMPKYKKGRYGDEKKRRNPKNRGRYDLKNKSNYRDNIKVNVSGQSVKYFSTDKKNRYLRDLNPLGLMPKSRQKLINIKLRPMLVKKIRIFLLR